MEYDYQVIHKTGSQCREPGCPRTSIAIFSETSTGRKRQVCGRCGNFLAAAGWVFWQETEWAEDVRQTQEGNQRNMRDTRRP